LLLHAFFPLLYFYNVSSYSAIQPQVCNKLSVCSVFTSFSLLWLKNFTSQSTIRVIMSMKFFDVMPINFRCTDCCILYLSKFPRSETV